VKTHLPVTTLEPQGRGTSSHVSLLIRAPYSSIAMCQFRSIRAARAKVGMVEGGDEEAVAMRVSRSRGSQKLSLARVTIG
jgi:hypothetical protein